MSSPAMSLGLGRDFEREMKSYVLPGGFIANE